MFPKFWFLVAFFNKAAPLGRRATGIKEKRKFAYRIRIPSALYIINIAKGATDPRVEFISQVLTQIFKFQFQILDYKALTLKSQPNISISTKSKVKILTKPSFRILTKIQLRNLNQTSAAKFWPNFNFKISPELQLVSYWQALPMMRLESDK